jgi:hypothetical protein
MPVDGDRGIGSPQNRTLAFIGYAVGAFKGALTLSG